MRTGQCYSCQAMSECLVLHASQQGLVPVSCHCQASPRILAKSVSRRSRTTTKASENAGKWEEHFTIFCSRHFLFMVRCAGFTRLETLLPSKGELVVRLKHFRNIEIIGNLFSLSYKTCIHRALSASRQLKAWTCIEYGTMQ